MHRRGFVYHECVGSFAIFENLKKPEEYRILLNQDPFLDLVYGFFYYSLVIVSWYLMLRKINYSKKEIFFITGIYGIFVEETGQVFLRIFTTDITGLLYAIFVIFIYGLFPMLGYMLTEKNFNQKRKPSKAWNYLLAILVLFLQWAIYGNFISPFLKNIFS